ncbi:MAG: hypothetical protein IKI46_00125 [Lachnospiraceae bacterium]|nr:hypothetical protein [Lachnospiraceae bacterium]
MRTKPIITRLMTIAMAAVLLLSGCGSSKPETGLYTATFTITDEMWKNALGSNAGEILKVFEGYEFSLDFHMVIYSDKTAEFSADYDKFVNGVCSWLDNNYISVLKRISESEGMVLTGSAEREALANKSKIIDSFRKSLESSMNYGAGSETTLKWKTVFGKMYFIGGNDKKTECTLNDDGSFTITFTSEDLGTDIWGDAIELNFKKV